LAVERILKSFDDTAATPETASIGSGKIMSLARPIGLPKDREEEPIVRFWPTAKRAAPRTIEWGRGEVEKFKVVGARPQLRRIMTKYAAYYNELRTNRSLNKEAPFHRAIQRLGAITSQPVLGGLHHQHCRI
jgi:hypothetical protein